MSFRAASLSSVALVRPATSLPNLSRALYLNWGIRKDYLLIKKATHKSAREKTIRKTPMAKLCLFISDVLNTTLFKAFSALFTASLLKTSAAPKIRHIIAPAKSMTILNPPFLV
jgi:hypothetical protein